MSPKRVLGFALAGGGAVILNSTYNSYLVAGAALSALAALLHIGCIVFGAPWYRFFGAGERMAQLAAAGSAFPAVVTACIATVLMVWAVYALSGAGVIARLPLLKPVLLVITGIYLLRGAAVLPMSAMMPGRSSAFWWWSSGICFAIGLVHAIGLGSAWETL